MERILDLITKVIPFLAPYPVWVKFIFSFWVLLTATLGLALIFGKRPELVPQPSAEGSEKTSQAWLVIKRVQVYSFEEQEIQVRVTAKVNGNEFVYPSLEGVKWVRIGPDMSPQRFNLPPTGGVYEVRFVMDGVYRNEPFKMLSQWVEHINKLPFSGEYTLHTYDLPTQVRSGQVSATVQYEINNGP